VFVEIGDTARHEPVGTLRALLKVTQVGPDVFDGIPGHKVSGRVYGGLVLGQALAAAEQTVKGKSLHSAHTYFLRPGIEGRPITYRVERDLDGRSFANRRIVACQGDRKLLAAAVSFHQAEPGLAHAEAMPKVPSPEDVPCLAVWAERNKVLLPEGAASYLRQPSFFEIRPITSPSFIQMHAENTSLAWIRLVDAGEGAFPQPATLLAYISDYGLLSSALAPHAVSPFSRSMQIASLDHAMWFHAEPATGSWLLHATTSSWTGNGRGHASGKLFTQDGSLVAQTAQEGLLRLIPGASVRPFSPHLP
jgi:acyl-CoA thioesterase-2